MLIRETQHLIFHDVSSCMPTANRSKFHNWSARDQKNNLTSPSTHSISGESLYKRASGLCSTHEDQTGFTCLSGHWCSKLYTLLCLHLVVSNLRHAKNCTENSRAHVLTDLCLRRPFLKEWEVLIVGETKGAITSHLTTRIKKNGTEITNKDPGIHGIKDQTASPRIKL